MTIEPTIPFDRVEFEQGILARFEKVVARLPAHPAIVGNGQQWTYGQLDRRANQIAHAILKRTSPGPGCVAYLVDHWPEMVICALAVLKAAKAFLCIHPGLPANVQLDVIHDAVPDLLLCDASHESRARELAGEDSAILLLADIDDNYSTDAPGLIITPHHPAVIFYTSGSTGRPKGVVKNHRAVLHRAWLAAQYDFVNPTDRQSLLTYCSFASSEADVFGSLLNGATLDLFDVGSRGLNDFGAWIDEHQITLLHPPVVLFRRFFAMLEGANLHASVRLVALAGETVVPSDIEHWRRRFSSACALRHRFSSTEAGHLAVACIEPGSTLAPGLVPTACPVTDKYLSVVDEHGQSVKDGEAGELLVRSAFLSDGYWRDATESAANFLTDPDHPDQRFFRSGDLGRILSDGNFEFLGRRDNQVKIRGYRVEMGEIENAFLKLPGVKEAAVIAERRDNETFLIVFVSMQQGSAFHAHELRAAMRQHLPLWKIPEQIHAVETLPLTLTGKIDRQRLKEFVTSTVIPNSSKDATDETTAQLIAIWEEMLRQTTIRPHDDFFDLGGNSLTAIQMMQQVKKKFGRSLPVATLYEASTPTKLANILNSPNRAAISVNQIPVVVALRERGKHSHLFCIPAAGGSAMRYVPLARLLNEDQSIYALQFPEMELDSFASESLEQIASRFIQHIRRIRPQGPYHLCGQSFGAMLAYEIAQQLLAAGECVEMLAMFDGRAPGLREPVPLHGRLLWYIRRLRPLGPRAAILDTLKRLRRRFRPPPPSPRTPAQLMEGARARIFRAYHPLPYAGSITLFRAKIQSDMYRYIVPQPFNGWDRICRQIELYHIRGDHFSMLREPGVSALAEKLNDCLMRLDKMNNSHS